MKRRRRKLDLGNQTNADIGFQIAPMIDVVFVIMLFFMVMAGNVTVERELNTTLPGSAETSTSQEFADEQVIAIQEDGTVLLNEEPMGNPGDATMQQLRDTLVRLKSACDQAKSQCLVTVVSEPQAKYARTVDVLDALSTAGIGNVTFTVNEEQ